LNKGWGLTCRGMQQYREWCRGGWYQCRSFDWISAETKKK